MKSLRATIAAALIIFGSIALLQHGTPAVGQVAIPLRPTEVEFDARQITNVAAFATATTPKDGEACWLKGYTTTNDGGQGPFVYHSTGRPTANTGTLFNGPGADDYYERQFTESFNVLWFGVKGDFVYPSTGTDDSTAIQACFDAAQVNATADASNRKIVKFPPRDYKFETPLTVDGLVDIDMQGAILSYTGTDTTQALLTIGPAASVSDDGRYIGVSVRVPTYFNLPFRFPADDDDRFACVRVQNTGNAYFDFDMLEGANIGLQLFPNGAALYVGYCEFHLSQMSVVKTGIELRGNTGAAWVNSNNFYGGNFSASSSIQPYGSVVGVRYVTEPAGYTGNNHNVFHGPIFQVPGDSATYAWSASMTVNENQRYRNTGTDGFVNDYVVTGGGDSQLAGTNAPTQTTGTFVDNGGVTWTYDGEHLSTCVLHDGVGGQNRIVSCRWEGGSGAFATVRNTSSSILNNDYEIGYLGSDEEDNAYVDDYGDKASVISQNMGSVFIDRVDGAYSSPPSTTLDNLQFRAIGSGLFWTCAGISFTRNTTPFEIKETSGGTFGTTILCNDRVEWQEAPWRPTIFVDVENLKRFRYHRHEVTAARTHLTAYDSGFNRLEITDANLRILAHNRLLTTGYLYEPAAVDDDIIIVIPPVSDVRYVAISNQNNIAMGHYGYSLTPIANMATERGFTASIVSPYGPSLHRKAFGTPDEGFFRSAGEWIANLNTTASEPRGWYVTTPGALAPAWVAATAVIKGELRENGGNVYHAVAAGTTDNPGTAPVHTSGSVSDGVVDWMFLCAEAVLTPVAGTETVTTAAPALTVDVSTQIDSTSNAVDGTLGAGTFIGQTKTIVMTEASNSSTVSVALHETSDPEIGTFDAVDEYWLLVWTGTEWATVSATCTFL